MKKNIAVLGTIISIVSWVPGIIAQPTVTLTQNANSYYDGGEFDAVTTPSMALGNYSSYTASSGGFETFCIESSVYFTPGVTYYYTLGQTEVSPSINLTLGAAWLYSQFAQGSLSGYDFANSLGQRNADAGALQAALWALQGNQVEPGDPYSSSPLTGNQYYNDAISEFGSLSGAEVASDGAYGVDVLQLWENSNDTGPAQDQLVMLPPPPSPVPECGSTFWMLAFGLVPVAFAGRRMQYARI